MVFTLVESQEWEATSKHNDHRRIRIDIHILRNLTVVKGMFCWDLLEVLLSIENMNRSSQQGNLAISIGPKPDNIPMQIPYQAMSISSPQNRNSQQK